MDRQPASAWWRGQRGEWYALAQVVLLATVFFGPRNLAGWPPWPDWLAGPATPLGIVLMAAGATLLVAGGFGLGAGLTPLPYPSERGALRQTGAFGVVRHPMYTGGIAMSFGWALAIHGGLTLVYATAVLIFAEVKAGREERWLLTAYPEYASYRKRVRKLIPLVH